LGTTSRAVAGLTWCRGAESSITHADLEVANPEQVRSVPRGIGPTRVINTSAYHRVDDCEIYVIEAFRVNARGHTSRPAASLALLLHFSTDHALA
jgi:dTDP-4-dehydrorhamnose reductase